MFAVAYRITDFNSVFLNGRPVNHDLFLWSRGRGHGNHDFARAWAVSQVLDT